MCPACIATGALLGAGVTSAGGLTAFVVKLLRAKASTASIDPITQTKGDQNGSPESRVTR
jgi:hypothetical protein